MSFTFKGEKVITTTTTIMAREVELKANSFTKSATAEQFDSALNERNIQETNRGYSSFF